MSVWDYSTMCRVLDAHTDALVDPSRWGPDAPADMTEGLTHALVRRHQRAIREWFATSAVDDEPHAEDCRIHSREDPARMVWQLRADWRPTTQAVELVGGYRDGEVIALANPLDHDKFRLPEPPSRPCDTQDYDARVYPERFTAQTYVRSGWNNTERRWRYSLEASR